MSGVNVFSCALRNASLASRTFCSASLKAAAAAAASSSCLRRVSSCRLNIAYKEKNILGTCQLWYNIYFSSNPDSPALHSFDDQVSKPLLVYDFCAFQHFHRQHAFYVVILIVQAHHQ